jgi:membrane-associated phospholipid phosphatase
MKLFRESTAAEAPRAEAQSWGYDGLRLSTPWAAALNLSEVWRACGAFEWVTLGYLCWLIAALAIFHRNVEHPSIYFAIHLGIGVAVACLAWAASRSSNGALRFVRHWYPLPLYIFFFEELEGLVHMVFPSWLDRWLIEFDYRFVGVHPSVWLARFSSPALNDFMQFAYMTYFLYLVVLPAILYAERKQLAFWTVMVSTAVAHYSVYVMAVLLPIESPYYSLASLQSKVLGGGGPTALIELIERFGRVHGAAFPSAHVAGSMVAICASWRFRRWLFWICLPLFVSMCVATVYGRYHYIADVLAGIAVGGFGFVAGNWLIQRKGAIPASEIAD